MSHLTSIHHDTETTERYDEITGSQPVNSCDAEFQASNRFSSSSIPLHSSIMENPRKPADSFDYSDTPTLHDEFISTPRNTNRSSRTRYWWNKMTVRDRKQSLDEIDGFRDADAGDGLLTGLHKTTRRQRKKNGIFNYFVFGGISGFSIL